MDVGDDCDAHGLPGAARYLSGARRRVGGRRVSPVGLDEGARRDRRLGARMRRDFFTGSCCTRAYSYERFFRLDSLLAVLATILVFWLYARYGQRLHARVGGRADRHGDAARDARLRARLARQAAVPGRGALVGPPARRHRTSAIAEVIFGGWLALGVQFVFLCVAVLVVMGFARLVGDRWWIPGSAFFIAALRALRLHLTVPRRHEPQAHQPAVRHRRVHRRSSSRPTSCATEEGARLGPADPRAERPRRHERRERVHGRLRADARRSSSGTRSSTAASRAARSTSSSPTSSATRRAST